MITIWGKRDGHAIEKLGQCEIQQAGRFVAELRRSYGPEYFIWAGEGERYLQVLETAGVELSESRRRDLEQLSLERDAVAAELHVRGSAAILAAYVLDETKTRPELRAQAERVERALEAFYDADGRRIAYGQKEGV